MHVGLGLNMISPLPRASQSEQPAREKRQKHSRAARSKHTLSYTCMSQSSLQAITHAPRRGTHLKSQVNPRLRREPEQQRWLRLRQNYTSSQQKHEHKAAPCRCSSSCTSACRGWDLRVAARGYGAQEASTWGAAVRGSA